jgi:hypothetical protein
MAKTAIQVRVSAEQRDAIRACAEQADLGVSEYVRRAALGELDATPPLAASSPQSEQSAPAADDLEARIAARAKQLHLAHGRTKRVALAEARRELA